MDFSHSIIHYNIFKKLYCSFVFFLLVAAPLNLFQFCANGKPVHGFLCNDRDVEPLIGKLVRNATAQMPSLLPLPNKADFVELLEGVSWGLSTLRPNRSCSVLCKESEAIITAHLYVEEMKGRYRWQRRQMTRTLEGQVNMEAEEFNVFIEIKQNRKGEQGPKLATVSITRMHGIDVDVTGQNYITWPLVMITGPAIDTFKQTVHDAVKGKFREALVEELERVHFYFQNNQ